MNLTFSEALESAKKTHRIARKGWNGKNMWVSAQYPDEHSKMKCPYLYMSTVSGDLIPWTVSQADIFAQDWEVLQDSPNGD